jgi:ferrochelatase
MRWQPALRFLPPYYDDPLHIDALAVSIGNALAKLDFTPDAIVASFHGMPERTLYLGDPYHCQCQKSARLLSEKLGRELIVTFQSRFGREGKRKVAIFAPGFSADCLETLEELAIQGKQSFIAAGGKDFAYIPCLNDSETGIAMLEALVRRELSGWI